MRRYFSVGFDGTNWVASHKDTQKYWWGLPDKNELLTILNTAQTLTVGNWIQVPSDATHTGFDGGNQVEIPGIVLAPGTFYSDTGINIIQYLLAWFQTTNEKHPSEDANPSTVTKRQGVIGKGPSGTLQLTILQTLWFTYTTLTVFRKRDPDAQAAANELLFVIQRRERGEIDDVQAITLYQQIIARHPRVFSG